MFINKLFTFLHFVHLSKLECFLIVVGYINHSKYTLVLGAVILLFKMTITLGHINNTEKTFKQSESAHHSLKYTESIPVFTLISDDDYETGFIHGRVLHNYIKPLHYRVLFLSLFHKFPKNTDLIIPLNITRELQGLVDGYNSCDPFFRLTFATALNWHLLPMACTTAINNSDKLVFARNMDWVPYGNLAKYSLVIHNKKTGVSSFSIPGLIGTITGWNRNGLILAMNVCTTETHRGIPAVLNNRMLLEKYSDVTKIKERLTEDISPYGAYHLTLLDKNKYGATISYYQADDKSHLVRNLVNFKERRSEIITYNHTYQGIKRLPGGRFFSDERDLVRKENPSFPIEEIFRMYPINNWITCQTLFFYPDEGIIMIGFDNGFSATSNLHELPFLIEN